MSFFSELKRRNVFRTGVAYLAVAWLALQVADMVLSNFGTPPWIIRALIFTAALGFPVVLLLAWYLELTPDGVKAESDPDAHLPTGQSRRKVDLAIIAVLLLAVGFLASRDLFVTEEQPSIAVLPFVNQSPDPEQVYFAEGVAEEILNLLAQVTDFRVISRNSSFSFGGGGVDIPTVADRLDVDHVLAGSVRRDGDDVVIIAQLIDARTDTQIWSERYPGTLESMFELQEEIAASVLDELNVTLLDGAPRPRNYQANAEAWSLYQRARHIINARDEPNYPVANRLLNEALATDENFVPAIIELGRLNHSEGGRGMRPREEGVRLAREAMERALAIDSNNALAYSWLGYIANRYDGDFPGSLSYLERALEADPNNAEILGGMVDLVRGLGYLDEAIVMGEYARTHDPFCDDCYVALAEAYRDAGMLDEAEFALRDNRVNWPNRPHHYLLGEVLLLKGEPAAALEEFLAIEEGDDDDDAIDRVLGTALAYFDLGRTADYENALAALREMPDTERALIYAYAYVGDLDAAYAAIERLMVESDGRVDRRSVGTDAAYAKLRDDPRWPALQRRLGMAPDQIAALGFDLTLPR
ncbi:MAG TPA: hypothetical protein VIV14_01600 [Gammaproteobacteria bacterium]